ncbi:MAG: hypothetical protein DKM50_10905 [Candidatus Margulisiibacteriota bacterium]|nr:MAG: hypothetical protein A2X43_07715 [Candidatus Margulisbacteria bacterium GWD2_39_127]OGI03890.1 MAG: hypothetical protein A2X42_10020 [Candidatus Margulisbacteria bacterium GWF2_38_17]OGI08805.1 MAG: hypothetical protein A2X41_05095 [Candidatus Margulisbacteria bacterium GWE2_39_32]PZM78636.1 MAG: hypothetical protein DKM50_10905 [Candidatus Margulisiibacteriota bacterium]HAR61977.1 hypothetical protein [Candidatus Margulisiibacteriota bacterium]
MSRKKNGFTIIELMIALFIISIASAVLFASLKFFLNRWEESYTVVSREDQLNNTTALMYDDINNASSIITCNHQTLFIQLERSAFITTPDILIESRNELVSTASYYLYTSLHASRNHGKVTKLMRYEGVFNLDRDYGKGTVLLYNIAPYPQSSLTYSPTTNIVNYSIFINEKSISLNSTGAVQPRNIRKLEQQ